MSKLTETMTYGVYISTFNSANAALNFTSCPTTDIIVQALHLERVEKGDSISVADAAKYDNLIELAHMLGEPKFLDAEVSNTAEVAVAGVQVGFMNTLTRKAWAIN